MLPPRVPRPNYQIWIILGLVAVILGVSYFRTGELTELQSSKFEDMVQSRDIKKLVLIENEKEVEITLKPEALQNAKYKQEIEKNSPLGLNANGPHYKMKIGSIDKFIEKYDDLTKNLPREQKVDLRFEERNDIGGVLLQWGFLFLLLFGFWMLMRRMTGGGGPGAGVYSTAKGGLITL